MHRPLQMQELEEDLEEVATENEGLLGTTSRQLYRMQTRRGSAPLTRMSLGAKRCGNTTLNYPALHWQISLSS
jgi:hypothetical protein